MTEMFTIFMENLQNQILKYKKAMNVLEEGDLED